MTPTFRLVGIDPTPFEPLFVLSDGQLRRRLAARVTVTERPGFPCRVSLEDAELGETVLVLPYRHQPAPSPYRAAGPVFVRRGQRRRCLAPGDVPVSVTGRTMSLRAYDTRHWMVEGRVCEGVEVAGQLAALMARDDVAYVHLHHARQGCFSCTAERVHAPLAADPGPARPPGAPRIAGVPPSARSHPP